MTCPQLLYQSLILIVIVFGLNLDLKGQMFSVENQEKSAAYLAQVFTLDIVMSILNTKAKTSPS